MAMNDAAVPPDEVMNERRLIPSFFEAASASSLIRASTFFCCAVCGSGMYSPLETIWVGIGERSPSSTASAGVNFSSCSSLNQLSASRESGAHFDMCSSGSIDPFVCDTLPQTKRLRCVRIAGQCAPGHAVRRRVARRSQAHSVSAEKSADASMPL